MNGLTAKQKIKSSIVISLPFWGMWGIYYSFIELIPAGVWYEWPSYISILMLEIIFVIMSSAVLDILDRRRKGELKNVS